VARWRDAKDPLTSQIQSGPVYSVTPQDNIAKPAIHATDEITADQAHEALDAWAWSAVLQCARRDSNPNLLIRRTAETVYRHPPACITAGQRGVRVHHSSCRDKTRCKMGPLRD
jgi:hypothetical protein